MVMDPFALACAGLTGVGLGQAITGAVQVRRFLGQPSQAPRSRPPLTVLKPLHGDEPLLEAALGSLCSQDYPEFQIVFGVQDGADPAIAVVRRLQARFPRLDLDLVIDPTQHGTNRKVSNLINMLPAARHDALVIADSDIHSPPGYLDRLASSLEQEGVGLVTTLYSGRVASMTLAGQLGAASLNHTFLPGALLGRAFGREDCLGATMALTRATLERIGGFHALVDHVADDAVLGQLVRAKGLTVALAATIPATTVAETSLVDLFHHELRWARTVRSVAPLGFALSVLQFPLFWAALTLAASSGEWWAWSTFGLAWAVRGGLGHALDRALHIASPLTIWCLPFRDLFSVMVMLASYRSDRVAWRGQVHRVSRVSFTTTELASGEG